MVHMEPQRLRVEPQRPRVEPPAHPWSPFRGDARGQMFPM